MSQEEYGVDVYNPPDTNKVCVTQIAHDDKGKFYFCDGCGKRLRNNEHETMKRVEFQLCAIDFRYCSVGCTEMMMKAYSKDRDLMEVKARAIFELAVYTMQKTIEAAEND